MHTYQKIVRDGIPDQVRRNGGVPVTRELSPQQAVDELFKKLGEEAHEFMLAESREGRNFEGGDFLEVIHAICALTGIDLEEVEWAKAKFSGEQANVVFFAQEAKRVGAYCHKSQYLLALGHLKGLFDAVCKVQELDPKDIERARILKRHERGGFDGRIFLEDVQQRGAVRTI